MSNPVTHISIDLETLATSHDAVILAIAIVDSHGVSFCVMPSIAEQVAEGRALADDTLHWWFQQSDEARSAQCGRRVGLVEARAAVLMYFQEADAEYDEIRVWGNAPGFDCEILGHFLGGKPWPYYRERDVRTAREILPDRTRPRIAHCALYDAEAQLEDVMRYLHVGENGPEAGITPQETPPHE